MQTGNRQPWHFEYMVAVGLIAITPGCSPEENAVSRSGPKVVVVRRVERSASDEVETRFLAAELANEGDEPLRLGEVSASCGCTSAKVKSNIVPPGGTTVVSVEGQPPTTGFTPVRISIATNDARMPSLVLHWDLTANPRPPKLLSPTPSVDLGILRLGKTIADRSFAFNVLEEREKPPLLQSVRFDPSFCRVEGGFADEMPVKDSRFVTRSYRYRVNFLANPDLGALSNHINLHRAGDESTPWLVVPIRGRVIPIVRAVPEVIPIADRSGGPVVSSRLMIVCDDHSGMLDVECVDHDPSTVVRVVERQVDRVFFQVFLKDTGKRDSVRRLRFRVNGPVVTTLDVPVQLAHFGSN